MKKLLGVSGWLLLALFLISSLISNKFLPEQANKSSAFISWQDHFAVYQGALSCSLIPDELRERLEKIKAELFVKVTATEELEDGYIFYFDDKNIMLDSVFEFVTTERMCCPFFKFDVSVLPFKKGLALRVSGSKAIKSFVADYLDFD